MAKKKTFYEKNGFILIFIEIYTLLTILTNITDNTNINLIVTYNTLLTIFMQLFILLTILITYATYNTNTYTTCITYNTIRLILQKIAAQKAHYGKMPLRSWTNFLSGVFFFLVKHLCLYVKMVICTRQLPRTEKGAHLHILSMCGVTRVLLSDP